MRVSEITLFYQRDNGSARIYCSVNNGWDVMESYEEVKAKIIAAQPLRAEITRNAI